MRNRAIPNTDFCLLCSVGKKQPSCPISLLSLSCLFHRCLALIVGSTSYFLLPCCVAIEGVFEIFSLFYHDLRLILLFNMYHFLHLFSPSGISSSSSCSFLFHPPLFFFPPRLLSTLTPPSQCEVQRSRTTVSISKTPLFKLKTQLKSNKHVFISRTFYFSSSSHCYGAKT